MRVAGVEQAAAFMERCHHLGHPVLFQAARTSLTGGAIPQGEIVLSVERLDGIGPVERHGEGGRITVGAGVRLRELQRHVASRGLYFPPVPTYQEAMVGGTLSTNAGGAASFKYGVTRHWVQALEVVLFDGDVLQIERGQARVPAGRTFEIELTNGSRLSVPTPTHCLPALKKISAGYHAADPLDLVDLFIGAEGTLGLVTAATLELVREPPAVVTGLTFLPSEERLLGLAEALRRAAERARATGDDRGPDVRAVESIDVHGLDLLRAHGDSRRLRVSVPPRAGAALLFELELPEPTTDEQAQRVVERWLDGDAATVDAPLTRLLGILGDHDAVDSLELAFPDDERRRRALLEFREAVPTRVNEILSERRRADPQVEKVGGDLIVPFDRLAEMLEIYRGGFERRGLEYAIWGHVSDGNMHPNAIPRDRGEVALGFEALLEFADEAVRRGGAPLSEHGVGRNPVKQRILERFVGAEAIMSMRRIKQALDPHGRLAPGVLFPPDP